MQELIDDLRAALDQMNRSLEEIKMHTKASAEYLKEIKERAEKEA